MLGLLLYSYMLELMRLAQTIMTPAQLRHFFSLRVASLEELAFSELHLSHTRTLKGYIIFYSLSM